MLIASYLTKIGKISLDDEEDFGFDDEVKGEHWSKLTTLEHELEAQTLLGANNSKNINIC